MKKITSLILIGIILLCTCSCEYLFTESTSHQKSEDSSSINITVHYYDEITRTYTTSNGKSIQCEFLAPSGQRIVGLFDSSGVQYSDYRCNIDVKSGMPLDLYAKYDDVDLSYLDSDPFTVLDDEPRKVSYYNGITYTWNFDISEYSQDEEMIAGCLCNPYADLIITVSFLGKGDSWLNHSSNEFQTDLKVYGKEIGHFYAENLGDDYTLYTYSGTVKAKDFTNGNYEVKLHIGAKLGSEDYTVKNFRIDFKFDFQ